MINGVLDVTKTEYSRIKAVFILTDNVYLCEVDGQQIVDEPTFYLTIGTALGAPRDWLTPITNMNWFYDELTTYAWLEHAAGRSNIQQFVIAIHNPDAAWASSQWSLRDFFQDVANFWVNEVEHVVVGGQARGFSVYLIHEI
jgi:hypothetical protein